MQSDNAAAFNSVIMNHFMAASHVTKVSSTPGHPRGNGLVERQNRTLLTLLRVFTTRRMQSWDKHLDEVLGAYNSTRHATTGFSPTCSLTGMEKSIPLSFLYPEFAAKEVRICTKPSYRTWSRANRRFTTWFVVTRIKRSSVKNNNTTRKSRQTHITWEMPFGFSAMLSPKEGTRKLLRGWRGPYKITDVLQDGRVYVLDTGQKVHYERLKPHKPSPWEWTTEPTPDRDVAIIVDPYPEDLNDSVDSDITQPSYLPEAPLSEASAGSYPQPSAGPSHGMRTRTRAAQEAGRGRKRISFLRLFLSHY